VLRCVGAAGVKGWLERLDTEIVTEDMLQRAGQVVERVNTTLKNYGKGTLHADTIDSEDAAGHSVVVVTELVLRGAAMAGGLLLGDEVVRVNGIAIKTSQQLTETVASMRAGEKVAVRVKRGRIEHIREVVLGSVMLSYPVFCSLLRIQSGAVRLEDVDRDWKNLPPFVPGSDRVLKMEEQGREYSIASGHDRIEMMKQAMAQQEREDQQADRAEEAVKSSAEEEGMAKSGDEGDQNKDKEDEGEDKDNDKETETPEPGTEIVEEEDELDTAAIRFELCLCGPYAAPAAVINEWHAEHVKPADINNKETDEAAEAATENQTTDPPFKESLNVKAVASLFSPENANVSSWVTDTALPAVNIRSNVDDNSDNSGTSSDAVARTTVCTSADLYTAEPSASSPSPAFAATAASSAHRTSRVQLWVVGETLIADTVSQLLECVSLIAQGHQVVMVFNEDVKYYNRNGMPVTGNERDFLHDLVMNVVVKAEGSGVPTFRTSSVLFHATLIRAVSCALYTGGNLVPLPVESVAFMDTNVPQHLIHEVEAQFVADVVAEAEKETKE